MSSDDGETGHLLVVFAESTLKARRLRKEIAEITKGMKQLVASLEDNPGGVSVRDDTFYMPLKKTRVSLDQLSELKEKVLELSLVEKDLECAEGRLSGNPLWAAFKRE